MKTILKKAVRAFIAILITSALLGSYAVSFAEIPEIPETEMAFDDVDPGVWSYEYIYNMYALGIMNGVNDETFGRTLEMTRAMFVTALAGLDGENISGYETDAFDDVSPDDYYYHTVAWAKDKGIANGTGENVFSPDAALSREDLVLMLFAYCKYKGIDVSNTDQTLLGLYYDDYTVSSYAKDAFAWAVNYGLIGGVSKACAGPKIHASREQVACILWKVICYDPAAALPVPEKIHLVRFIDYDGTMLFGMRVADGDSAVYPFRLPSRPMTSDYRYTFAGWSRYYDCITEDLDIRAVYKPHKRVFYSVKFINYDGGLLQAFTVEQGYGVEYSGPVPVRPKDFKYSYTFTGWDGSAVNVQSDLTLTAQFSSAPLVIESADGIENKYDKFTYNMINVNNSDFRLSKSLYDRLYNASTYAGGRKIGFYLIDIGTGMSVGYNAADSFPTASTVKLGLALYAYKQIAAGNAKLTDRITYRSTHYCDGSGVLINSASYGQSFTLKYLLHIMIHESDNIAYYMVHDYFGTAGYNAMIRSLGGFNMHYSTRTWGYLTPQELGLIWREIYRFKDPCWEGEYFFNELLNAKFNFIKQGLDYKYKKIAHKSGFNGKGYHDSAVIFGDRPYIMVIMMSPSLGYNQGYLSKLAYMLDEVELEYINWLKIYPR